MSDEEDYVLLGRRPKQPSMPKAFHLPKLNGHDMFEITVSELQHLFVSGAFTSKQYTQFCLDRIQRTNQYLEAVIETNPEALDIADGLDNERRQGQTRGPLHGVPVLVKDNMATADRMQTTAGSWALLGCTVPKDAHVVQLLRKAGAVIIGKANMDEWAGMRGSTYSTGFSARGGQCRNPYQLIKEPSGSSSGSAVSVSANIVPLSLGTETDTSIIGPAIANGVVGIKPTVGLTSKGGVIPISETQDSVGPFGRTVADATIALDVIAGTDEDDKHTKQPARYQPHSYFAHLADRHELKGAKFGLPMKRCWELAPPPQRAVVEKVLDYIRAAGAEIVPVELPCAEERIHPDGHWDWERYGESQPEISEITVSKVETYYLMREYLSKLENTPMRSLEDIVEYNDQNSGSEGGHAGDHPAFYDGQDLFRRCVTTQGIKDETYHTALKHCQSQCRTNGIDAALQYTDSRTGESTNLDALLFCDIKMAGQCIAAQAGYPIVAIPVGLDPDGMPVSLTLQHTAWQEAKLIKWASAIEDLCLHHQGPRATPTYKDHLRKNVPVEYAWKYPGAPKWGTSQV
ncbi:hypothetical protein LTR56_012325 [Elasticomyces elasticus]|nr:hypothetical protein LTR56_012325 [Elasticomyces elasticus]KAK3641281.1 hypothetical protein LTR22_016649 [Elasticomyces elasticus]KAK4922610.1 hypothetical protein LTR49_010137 [Elasticomyces elasticus]KAK5760783.1 hypothetical protein LTS12_009141 [Elasticomyces elasticus]